MERSWALESDCPGSNPSSGFLLIKPQTLWLSSLHQLLTPKVGKKVLQGVPPALAALYLSSPDNDSPSFGNYSYLNSSHVGLKDAPHHTIPTGLAVGVGIFKVK